MRAETCSEAPHGPVFVVSAPHSGGSALAWSLAQSQSIRHAVGAGWLTELCASLAVVEDAGRKVKGRGASITSVGHLAQAGVGGERFWSTFGASIDAIVNPTPANGTRPGGSRIKIGRLWSKSHARRRWLSAESEIDRMVHGLAMMFPDAQFLHVVRRPETAVAAMTTRSRANPAPFGLRAAARRWTEAVRNGLDAERSLGTAVLRVEYEALAVDPGGTLRNCFEFLGMDWDEACLRPLNGGSGSLAGALDVPSLGHLPEAPVMRTLLEELAGSLREDSDSGDAQARLREALLRRAGLVKQGPAVPAEVRRVRAFVAASVPAGAKVLVVSRGEESLLDIKGVVAEHFPQTEDGIYSGHHPGSSEDAVAHLEALSEARAEFFVIPRAAFWWCDYYQGLREHLLRRYRVAGYQPECGIVFALSASAASEPLAVRYREEGRRVRPCGQDPAADGGVLAGMFASSRDHFVIAHESAAITAPAGWPVRDFGQWRILCHPAQPVRVIQDASGEPAGWLIGHAVSSATSPDHLDPVRLDWNVAEGPRPMEESLYRLSGRYVALLRAGGSTRLYLDAGGSLGAVHSVERQVVGSTTSLVEAVIRGPGFPRPEPGSFPADRENQFFPGGMTHHPSMRRVLPNHYLDLDSWTVRRHWPACDIEPAGELGLGRLLHDVAAGMEETIAGVAGSFDIYMGMTAGRDCRALLACSRAVAGSLTPFTFDYGDREESVVDLRVAQRLAGIAGLDHFTVPITEPTAREREQYLFRIGHAGHWGKARDHFGQTRHLKTGRALVPGFFGELGRGFYWRGMPKTLEELNPEVVLRRMRLPCSKQFVAAMQAWLEGLPAVSPRLLLDLLYLENRGGAWASPHIYGNAPFQAVILPFASRRVIDSMFRLPYEYRFKKRLYEDLILLRWPELLEPPFDALGKQDR